jgi:hypothetical protein
MGARISRSQCPRRGGESFGRRRPRHTQKGRQGAREVERTCMQLRKQRAGARDIVRPCGGESGALTRAYPASALAQSGAGLRAPAPGQAQEIALTGSPDHAFADAVALDRAIRDAVERLNREKMVGPLAMLRISA